MKRGLGLARIAFAVLTVVSLFLVTRLSLSKDLTTLFPHTREADKLAEVTRAFGGGDLALVLVRGEDPAQVTAAARRAAEELSRTDVVAAVHTEVPAAPSAMDPTEAWRFAGPRARERLAHAVTPEGMAERLHELRALLLAPGAGDLADVITKDPLRLSMIPWEDRIEVAAGVSGAAGGAFVSADGKARLVVLEPKGRAFDPGAAAHFTDTANDALARVAVTGVTVELTGGHVVARQTEQMIKSDLTKSGALSVALASLMFALTFPRRRALLAVLPPLAVGTLWTTAIAAAIYPNLSAIATAFTAVVIGVGVDTGVHVYGRLLTAIRDGVANPADVARRATWKPTLGAAVAAGGAFGCLYMSDIEGMKQLGVLCAAGEVLTAVAILIVVPELGVLLERRRGKPFSGSTDEGRPSDTSSAVRAELDDRALPSNSTAHRRATDTSSEVRAKTDGHRARSSDSVSESRESAPRVHTRVHKPGTSSRQPVHPESSALQTPARQSTEGGTRDAPDKSGGAAEEHHGDHPNAATPRPVHKLGSILLAMTATRTRATVALAIVAVGVVASVVMGLPSLDRGVATLDARTLPALATYDAIYKQFGGARGQVMVVSRDRVHADAVAEAADRLKSNGAIEGYDALASVAPAPETQRFRLSERDALNLPARGDALTLALEHEGFAVLEFRAALDAFEHPSKRVTDEAPEWIKRRHLADGLAITFVRFPLDRDNRDARTLLQAADPDAVITGFADLERGLTSSLQRDLPRVLGGAILIVLIVLGASLKRPGKVALAFVVLAVEIALVLALARVFGVHWHVYDALVLPVLLGITLDEVLFLLDAAERSGSIDTAIAEQAPLGTATALTTAAGFGALVICKFPGLVDVGKVGALGSTVGLFVAVVAIPAFYRLRRAK